MNKPKTKWEKIENTRNAFKIQIGKPVVARLPARPRSRLEGNTKAGSEDVKWTELAQYNNREGVPVMAVPSICSLDPTVLGLTHPSERTNITSTRLLSSVKLATPSLTWQRPSLSPCHCCWYRSHFREARDVQLARSDGT
jgi:hypothetical protein